MPGEKEREENMRTTFGVLAHVDSGKTTFSEQILYQTGVVREPGRVDAGTAVMDGDAVEKARGITIYADQCPFSYQGDDYYLLDTPGHVDFSAETERAVTALDYAVLLVDASAGAAAHTVTLYKMLERFEIPVFFFLNKTDLATADVEGTMADIREKLTGDAFLLDGPGDLEELSEALVEFAAERDEELMEDYLEGKAITGERLTRVLTELIRNRKAFVCMKGSARDGTGIAGFLEVFHRLTRTGYREDGPFLGLVYKIRHDGRGQRVVFLKVLSGTLRGRDEVCLPEPSGDREEDRQEPEKVHEIRIYTGQKSRTADAAPAGSLCAVTGLALPKCGDLVCGPEGWDREEFFGMARPEFRMIPALQAQVVSDTAKPHVLLGQLRILEDEDPQLAVECREDQSILVNVMGAIQLEVLRQVLQDRFGTEASFLPPRILYRETIAAPVMGFGHYEPLRHYAEVHLRLEPAPRGSGISFASECHVDELAANYQNLVKTHVFERVHKGVLTGSPLTDVKIVLTAGRAHLKHTEGGDFREAVYRAVRQGLEKAETLLLEPWYRFAVTADQEFTGRILSDIQKRSGRFDPPEQAGNTVFIQGTGPAASFLDYGVELAAATRGRGSLSMVWAGYEPCHNPEEVIRERDYDRGADKENPSSSVFCSHGAGFVVNWKEVEQYIHLPMEVL